MAILHVLLGAGSLWMERRSKDLTVYSVIGLVLVISSSGLAAAPPQIPIQKNTALEKLRNELKENAVFKAAIASVPTTRIQIPDWLRAHFRRNHPEVMAVADNQDPTGGFPLALQNLYQWMLLHQDLKPPPAPEVQAAISAIVGQNLRISSHADKARSESDIRINLANPRQIIAASNNLDNGRQAQFFSSDGGVTWGYSTLDLLSGDSLHSDPTVDWTSDGKAWATTIGIDASTTVLQMRAYRSDDAGKTWIFDATFSGDQTQADKQMMWVDHGSKSPYRDNIYVIWHNAKPAFAARRTKTGWEPPVRLSGGETTGTAIGSDITTNDAGDVFAVWPDTKSKSVFVVASRDGGKSYSTPKQVGKTAASFQIVLPAFSDRMALVGTSIAAFQAQNHDDIYVLWSDLSGKEGCKVPNDEPGTNVNSRCTCRVWFTRSRNGGKDWDHARMIDDESEAIDQFNQKLAIDPETGMLGVTYYRTGSGGDRNKTNLMFRFSTDSGDTWSKATQVTSATTDETSAGADRNQYGDYNGLSVCKSIFFPCWTDRREGTAESIYTARITIKQNTAGIAEATLLPPEADKP